MPGAAQENGGRSTASTSRGDLTRCRLLDAIEAIAADNGIAALSHRAIARRARLHAGLIHYHFGTVENLLGEALARRAARVSQTQVAAISGLHALQRWTVGDVVAALWAPFGALGGAIDGGLRNYLCLVARLSSDEAGEALLNRHFEEVMNTALGALRVVLPDAHDESLRAGLRFTRILFAQESLERCRKSYVAERRSTDDLRLIGFAAAGLRELAVRS